MKTLSVITEGCYGQSHTDMLRLDNKLIHD